MVVPGKCEALPLRCLSHSLTMNEFHDSRTLKPSVLLSALPYPSMLCSLLLVLISEWSKHAVDYY